MGFPLSPAFRAGYGLSVGCKPQQCRQLRRKHRIGFSLSILNSVHVLILLLLYGVVCQKPPAPLYAAGDAGAGRAKESGLLGGRFLLGASRVETIGKFSRVSVDVVRDAENVVSKVTGFGKQ